MSCEEVLSMPDPPTFVLTIRRDPALRAAVEDALAPYAIVRPAPATYNLDEITLIVEIVVGATSVLSNLATVATLLIELRNQRKAVGQSSPIVLARPGDPS